MLSFICSVHCEIDRISEACNIYFQFEQEARRKKKEERAKQIAERKAEQAERREKREAEKREREQKLTERLQGALDFVHKKYMEKRSFAHVKIPNPKQVQGFTTFDDKFLCLQTHRLGILQSGNWNELFE